MRNTRPRTVEDRIGVADRSRATAPVGIYSGAGGGIFFQTATTDWSLALRSSGMRPSGRLALKLIQQIAHIRVEASLTGPHLVDQPSVRVPD
jgi:hypothetical protein